MTRGWAAFRAAVIAAAMTAVAIPAAQAAPVRPEVVNGRAPLPGEARALVSISAGGFSCGGTLVDAVHVITAAHCAFNAASGSALPPSQVRVGWSSTTTRAVPSLPVSRVSVHPDYDMTTFANDLAVLELVAPIPGATPMLVANATRSAIALAPGASVRSAGFGRISVQGPLSGTALVGDLTVLPDDVCGSRRIPYRIGTVDFYGYGKDVDTANAVCAVGVVPGTDLIIDTCQGDSGGPLFSGDGINARLVGVVSVGDGCAGFDSAGQPMDKKVPGIYARTGPALDWLASVGIDMSDTALAPPVIASAVAQGTSIAVAVQAGSATRLDIVTVTAIGTASDEHSCVATVIDGAGTCTVGPLTAGSSYAVTAVATAGDLVSAPSTPVSVSLPGKPGKPRIRQGYHAGPGRVDFVVTPGVDNGSPLTGTSVVCIPRGASRSDAPRAAGSVVGGRVTLTMAPGYRYTCYAVSTNAIGSTRSRPFSFAL